MSEVAQGHVISAAEKAVTAILELAARPLDKGQIENHIRMVRGIYPDDWQRLPTILKHLVAEGQVVERKHEQGWYKRKTYTLRDYTFGGVR